MEININKTGSNKHMTNQISRRHFVDSSVQVFVCALGANVFHNSLLWAAAGNTPHPKILLGFGINELFIAQLGNGSKEGTVTKYNSYLVDADVHSIAADPKNPSRFVLFPKFTETSVIVTVPKHGKKVDVIRVESTKGRKFYGHGCYSVAGDQIFATEAGEREACVSVRDAKTGAYLKEMPTYASSPHEVLLVDQGKTLAVANSGLPDVAGSAKVTFVDIESSKLKESYEIDHPNFSCQHLLVTDSGLIIAALNSTTGKPLTHAIAVGERGKDKKLTPIEIPAAALEKIQIQVLSLSYHEPSGVLAATCMPGNSVTLWDLKNHKYIKSIDMMHPTGIAITQSGEHFIVASREQAPTMLISTKTLEARSLELKPPLNVSAHLTMI
jgi:uncharacterized protein